MTIAKYFHTVRYLRPPQVYGRVLRKIVVGRPDLSPPPPLRAISARWLLPPTRPQSLFGAATVRLLNREHTLASSLDWNHPEREKLWLYNLHYFDDLNGHDSHNRADVHLAWMRRWVAENPVGIGCGWEPYPASLRIVNWIKWALRGNSLPDELRHSLAVQVRCLRATLEKHLLGNHLLANAKTLIFAGIFFEGPEAARWLQHGFSIFRDQLREQILSDGAHFELSTMYHCFVLEDVLDVFHLLQCCPGVVADSQDWQARLTATAASMTDWLNAMCHPDGQIAFFNDAVFGIAASPERLAECLRVVSGAAPAASADRTVALPASGYVRLQKGPAVAFLDTAAVGPDYLPAHAHADTLTFELSLFTRRVFVNTGVSTYTAGADRTRQRGTAAHNTVTVDGLDSSHVWGSFRVAHRARIVERHVEDGPQAVVWAAHDGYRRLRGRVVHRRTWSMDPSSLTITDELQGRHRHEIALRFHLHPAVTAVPQGRDTIQLQTADPTHVACLTLDPQFDVRVEPAEFHPEFGCSQSTVAIVGAWKGALPARFQSVLRWGPPVQ